MNGRLSPVRTVLIWSKLMGFCEKGDGFRTFFSMTMKLLLSM